MRAPRKSFCRRSSRRRVAAHREHVRGAKALRALTRVATADTEGPLLEMARASTASPLERICRGYRLALRTATGARPEDISSVSGPGSGYPDRRDGSSTSSGP